MRRVSLVSVIAAGVVLGHVVPHWLASRLHPSGPPPPTEPVRTARAALGAESPPPLVAPTCQLQPPLTAADREPMLDALRLLVASTDQRFPQLARTHRAFVRRFETCGVDVREFDDYVLVMTSFGGYWTGARFRKTPHGWVALQTDGGDIR